MGGSLFVQMADRGHSAELPGGSSRLEGLQPTGSLRQAELVVGMFGVGYIYHIYYVYTKHRRSEKGRRKWRYWDFVKYFFVAYCIYIVVDCFLKLQRVKFRVEIKNLTPGKLTTFFDQLNLQQPQDFQTLLGLSYVWWSKSFRQEHCTPIFSELKVRQSFSLRKRDRFEYLLCPSCFVVLCQSFPTMAESCVRYVRSFPSFFFSNCLLARRSFIAVEFHFAGDEKVCVYPPSG